MKRAIVFASVVALAGGCKKSEEQSKPQAESGELSAGSEAQAEGEATKAEGGTLVVYSGRSEKLIAPALTAFEDSSEIDLEIKYADTAQLAATLMEEGQRSPADVFIAQDASTLSFLAGKDVFAPLPEDLVSKVPKGFRAADGSWVGLSGRARVLAYNTDKLKEGDLPTTIEDLTDPKWKGRIGWAPENASFQSFVAAMLELRGKEKTKAWLEAMKKNQPKDYPKNTPAVMAVSRGEVDVALVNHYYLYRLKEEHGEDFPVANHYFRSGDAAALVNLSGAGVLKSSDDAERAHELVAYLLSPEGQKHFVAGNHEFPAVSDVASPDELPSIDSLKAPALDPAEIGNLEETVALLRETGVLR